MKPLAISYPIEPNYSNILIMAPSLRSLKGHCPLVITALSCVSFGTAADAAGRDGHERHHTRSQTHLDQLFVVGRARRKIPIYLPTLYETDLSEVTSNKYPNQLAWVYCLRVPALSFRDMYYSTQIRNLNS